MRTATLWLSEVRNTDPRKLAFFTGRDQSQALTGWWATQFGTPNYAAHGGFCSVNMAAAGLYTFGGSFWEFGEPDWKHTKYFLLFGVAEDHASNPIKMGLGQLKARGAKIVSVNPVRTGYSAIADEWIGIRPGTDGLFVGALIHELLKAGKIDLDYLAALHQCAVARDPGSEGAADDGLFARSEGAPLVLDRRNGRPGLAGDPQVRPALMASTHLPDGRRVVPVFQLIAERYLSPDSSPDSRRGALRHSGRHHPAHRRRARRHRLRPGDRARCAMDATMPAGAMRRWSAGRSRCMPCAASRPIPTASRPAAPSTSCRSFSAPSMCRAAFATSRPFPKPRRRR